MTYQIVEARRDYTLLEGPFLGKSSLMYDRLIWEPDLSRDVSAIRMPEFAFLDASTIHVFAIERRGTAADLNMGGENGFRASWRAATWDSAAEQPTLGAISVLDEPSGWADKLGTSGTFCATRITQGAHEGKIEVIWSRQQPNNVSFDTAGTTMDLLYATSADNYAAQTRLAAGAALYAQYPGVPEPATQAGGLPLPNALVEVPAGATNEGRRVATIGLNGNDGRQHPFTIYAERGSLFSDAFSYGELVSGLDALGVASTNESTLLYSDGAFHLYQRNDDSTGSPDFTLTKRGPIHARSLTGIGAWTNQALLSDVGIGNVQVPGAAVDDPSIRIVIFGSTAAVSGIRNQCFYFLSTDGETFFARVPSPFPAAVEGYGKLWWSVDEHGVPWLNHVYEAASGLDGFNFASCARWRRMNLFWLRANQQPM